MHGAASVNRAIDRSDLLFAVGMRFDDRITGAVNKFAPKAKIVHIDVDPSELGKVVKPTVGIAADAKGALRGILAHLEEASDGCAEWRAQIAKSQEPERRREDEARDEYGPVMRSGSSRTSASTRCGLPGSSSSPRRTAT
jgi:acetolactate synthase-1/2/3 large subunit